MCLLAMKLVLLITFLWNQFMVYLVPLRLQMAGLDYLRPPRARWMSSAAQFALECKAYLVGTSYMKSCTDEIKEKRHEFNSSP
ncbi:hypothetical protein GGR50DRAFT_674522 [Xylaria sp. CBS 124048]|nr:hypothetical protein GGR50DRAFT_674522 [Xylaria sp. CBS 124048]